MFPAFGDEELPEELVLEPIVDQGEGSNEANQFLQQDEVVFEHPVAAVAGEWWRRQQVVGLSVLVVDEQAVTCSVGEEEMGEGDGVFLAWWWTTAVGQLMVLGGRALMGCDGDRWWLGKVVVMVLAGSMLASSFLGAGVFPGVEDGFRISSAKLRAPPLTGANIVSPGYELQVPSFQQELSVNYPACVEGSGYPVTSSRKLFFIGGWK
ncbi:hypothetical protein Dimus_030354 [Dionaea muscipula]